MCYISGPHRERYLLRLSLIFFTTNCFKTNKTYVCVHTYVYMFESERNILILLGTTYDNNLLNIYLCSLLMYVTLNTYMSNIDLMKYNHEFNTGTLLKRYILTFSNTFCLKLLRFIEFADYYYIKIYKKCMS